MQKNLTTSSMMTLLKMMDSELVCLMT